MNKIYKLVWSKVRNTRVVASEIAKGHGKSSSSEGNGKLLKSLVSMAILGYFVTAGTSPVAAEMETVHYFSVNSGKPTNPDGTNWDNDGAKKDGSIAIGPSALNNGLESVAVGSESKVRGGWWSVALGTKSETNGNFTTAIGYGASATEKLSLAVGPAASATGLQSLAFGPKAEATAESAVSIGAAAQSLALRGVAIGLGSTVGATGGRGIAIGDNSYVGAKTTDHPGSGIPNPGNEWNPGEPYAQANDDTVAPPGKLSEENSIAIGMRASAFGFQTIALGAGAEAHNTNTTAVGVAAVARGNHSTALGKQARTFEKESTSVGHWADSSAEFATAIGASTTVYKKGGVALGFGASAYDENSIAIGSNSIAKEAVDGKAYLSEEKVKAAAGIVSVGNPAYKAGDKDVAANYRRIVNVAGGINDNDAVNVAQLKALETNNMNQLKALETNNMNQINKLRDESREGDAMGAAMAALKPLDFDPYQRSQVMAGVGYYRGKEAVALGLAHYKNEDLMFHGGLAYVGNPNLMANIGVTYRFGSKDDRDIKHDRNLRMPQYAEGPISSVYILQDEVDRLTKENKEANDRIATLEAKLEKVLEKVK